MGMTSTPEVMPGGADGAGELDAHVAETAEAGDADLLAGVDVSMVQGEVWGVSGEDHAGAVLYEAFAAVEAGAA